MTGPMRDIKPIEEHVWQAEGIHVHSVFPLGPGMESIVSHVGTFATEAAASKAAADHNAMLDRGFREAFAAAHKPVPLVERLRAWPAMLGQKGDPWCSSVVGGFMLEAAHVIEQQAEPKVLLYKGQSTGKSEAPALMPRISISFENSTLLKALRVATTRLVTFGDRHTKYSRLVLQLLGDQLSCAGVKENPDFREAAAFARDFTDMGFSDFRSRGHSAEAAEAMARGIHVAAPPSPGGEMVTVRKQQSMGKSEHGARLTREWLEETRRPVVLAGADINADGVTMHISEPNLEAGIEPLDPTFRLGGFVEEFASRGPAKGSSANAEEQAARGRAAILAKLVEWRRTGGVAFLGFYTDGEEDGGVHDARDIFRIEGVIDLGELIEAFAMAAAGHNFGERLDIAEAECAALAEANARYRILLDK